MSDPRYGPLSGLLDLSRDLAGKANGTRTHEQNVHAIFAIVRRKAHPAARLRCNADGSYTITIPPQPKSQNGATP